MGGCDTNYTQTTEQSGEAAADVAVVNSAGHYWSHHATDSGMVWPTHCSPSRSSLILLLLLSPILAFPHLLQRLPSASFPDKFPSLICVLIILIPFHPFSESQLIHFCFYSLCFHSPPFSAFHLLPSPPPKQLPPLPPPTYIFLPLLPPAAADE